MKSIKSYIAVFASLFIIASCENDLDRVSYDANDATPAIIENIEESYTLDVMQAAEVAMTLRWSEPDFGYSASVTNNIEMDLKGGDFSLSTTLASVGKGGEFSFKHSELNNSIAKLLGAYAKELTSDPMEFDIRVSSSISTSVAKVISDVVTTTITPYDGEREYSSIALRGDYNSWSFDNAQYLYSENDDENYAGMIYFGGAGANGWKLCKDADWSENWGVEGDELSEASNITLVSGGDNFTIYSGNSYYFEFNTSTLEFKVSRPYESWGVVGSYNDWGSSTDVAMTLGNSDNKFYLEATIDLEAGDEWKIRAENSWADSYGCSDLIVDEDIYMTDYGNFIAPSSGSYTIRWYFNKVEQSVSITLN